MNVQKVALMCMHTHMNIMARILENGITLVHPYSRNKSDKKNVCFLFSFLIHDIEGNNCEIDMSSTINYFSSQYSAFLDDKTSS